MEKLLPEHLKDFWQAVVRNEHTAEDYTREYDRALAEYRQTWERALILPAHQDLRRVSWLSLAAIRNARTTLRSSAAASKPSPA